MNRLPFYLVAFLSVIIIGCNNSNAKKNNVNSDLTNDIGYLADSCWSKGVITKRNDKYNDYFTRYGDGWTGGDATYSIALDKKTNLWIFGDSFLGTIREDRSRVTPSPLIHNTFVIEHEETFSTLYGGTPETPDAYIKPPEKDWWYWPGHGQIYNDTLQLIMFAIKPSGEEGMWGFEYAAIDIVNISISNLKVISIKRKMSFDDTNYGACVFHSNGYTYIWFS